ncbi:MAG TPA: hypothetical protein VMF50_15725 [Candidatus Binataceae bacterium]|nr:hypothetical protein [Candidatus Binataceae bacterium]
MSHKIDQFCEHLRVKLSNIEITLHEIQNKIEAKAQHVDQEVQGYLDKVQKRIAQNRNKVAASRVEMKEWMEARRAAGTEKIADLKAKHETTKLQHRADRAERYAAAALVVALAAADDAEEAALEAWLARHDADSAQARKAA